MQIFIPPIHVCLTLDPRCPCVWGEGEKCSSTGQMCLTDSSMDKADPH